MSYIEQLKALLGTDEAQSAKNILEWLGLVSLIPAGALTFIKYLKCRRGRKIEAVTPLTDADKTGIVEARVEGDGNSVHVHQHVYNLSENSRHAGRSEQKAESQAGRSRRSST